MKKVLMLAVGLFLLFSSIGFACATPLPPRCPDCVCNVSCPSYEGGVVQLPGYWEIFVNNKKVCGEVTIIDGSTALINDEIVFLNRAKRMMRVESCE